MAAPAFVVYKLVTLVFGAKAIEIPLTNFRHDLAHLAAAITPRTKLIYVCSPNNPTGTANTEKDLLAFARALPDHVVAVFDEAYADYVADAARDFQHGSFGRKLERAAGGCVQFIIS